MRNQVLLIGRIVNIVKLEEKISIVALAVTRDFKNEEGVYETDFINCVLKNTISESVNNWCRKGDLIAIRGHLDSLLNDNPHPSIVADKVSFLSSNKEAE